MNKIFQILSAVLMIGLLNGCAELQQVAAEGGISMEANVQVSFKVDLKDIPVNELPDKYKKWVDETNTYLIRVDWSVNEIKDIRKKLAVLFGVSETASSKELTDKIKNTVKKTVKLVIKAEAKLDASAGTDGETAYAKASGSGFVNAKYETTETMDPEVKSKLDQLMPLIQRMYTVPYVIGAMKDKGDELKTTGRKLITDFPNDVKEKPALLAKGVQIKGKIEAGSDNCDKADKKIDEVDGDARSIIDALQKTFPEN